MSAPARPQAGSEWARVQRRVRVPRALALAVILGAAAAALVLVFFRMDSIHLRYRLGEALQLERELLEEQRALTLEVRRLRDPRRLAELGPSLGLARPARVVTLPEGDDR